MFICLQECVKFEVQRAYKTRKDVNFVYIEALISLHKYIAYGIKGYKDLYLYFDRSVCMAVIYFVVIFEEFVRKL